jgi:hypothetical protein
MNKRKNKLVYKSKNGKYISSQLYTNYELCNGDHEFGDFDLLGPKFIAGKSCKKCSFIIYKDEVIKIRASKIEQFEKAKSFHVDLFHF